MIIFLFHTFFASGFAYLLSLIFGGLTSVIAVVSLLVGWFMAKRREKSVLAVFPDLKFFTFGTGPSAIIEVVLTTVSLYASFRHFAWLLFKTDSKWRTLHANNFGDLPLHINYIREIAQGMAFPPINPSFAVEPLRYPFGSDLYSALWEILGVPLESHLFLVGLACAIANVTVLRWFGRWWALGAFFFGGGLMGWSVLSGQVLPNDLTQNVDWKNLFLSVFITQRGLIFALPVSLILIEATRRSQTGEAKLRKSASTTLGILWGLLPLFHLHAFVIVSLMMAGYALSGGGGRLKGLLTSRMACFAYLPAIYFLLRSSDGLSKAKVLHIDPWWTSSFDQAPAFLVQNFGPWLILPVAVLIGIFRLEISREKRRALLLELALYSGLFVFFFNVMLAPWSWDNIKILIFPYLGFARLAWAVLDSLLPSLVKFAVAFLLFLSGFVAVERSLAPPVERGLSIYEVADLGAMEGALTEVPHDAVFAAAPTHNHPLTYFGRVRALGYEGHLWSHGIDYRAAYAKFDQFMRGQWNGADPALLARELRITHVVWGPAETTYFSSTPPWPETFRNVSRVPGLAIYEVPK